jgi:hypothetical protein
MFEAVFVDKSRYSTPTDPHMLPAAASAVDKYYVLVLSGLCNFPLDIRPPQPTYRNLFCNVVDIGFIAVIVLC